MHAHINRLRAHTPPRTRAELRTTIAVDPMRISTQSGSGSGSGPGPDDAQLYATRLATVVLVRRDGSVLFVERDVWQLDARGDGASRADAQSARVFRFDLQRG